MKKILILLFIIFLFFLSGCSLFERNNQESSRSSGIFGGVVNYIEDEKLETGDRYLISKTKELEIMAKIYHLEKNHYPVVYDDSENPKLIKIDGYSEDWQELEKVFKTIPSFKDMEVELSENILKENPIEYFSDGDFYEFKVYLNNNKVYEHVGEKYQCEMNEEGLCILTIDSK